MARTSEPTVLTLCLLRHAKSSWEDGELDDHERPLTERGARDAPRIGAWMADRGLSPDVVLCSDAVRTRATLALVLSELPRRPGRIVTEPALYLAEPAAIMAQVQAVGDARVALVIGHNPGLHALALDLVKDGEEDALKRLAMKFPTAGLAVLTLPGVPRFAEVREASGRLDHFVTPKSLAAG